jgi:TonB family protein
MFFLAFGLTCIAFGQDDVRSGTSRADVAMVNLFSLKYPPFARQANLTGDVEIKLEIRRDGSIQSAVVLSGHPMLAAAALTSAQQSRFECRGCEDELTTQSLIYSFQIVASPGWPCPESGGSHVTQSGNRVMVSAEPSMVYPVFSSIRSRSAKCFYLWACGSHGGGEDYYYYRVRSAKCLDLWACGHRLREPFATCSKLHREISY